MTAQALLAARSVAATLVFDASLLGAAELALEPLVADPAMWVGRREAVPKVSRLSRTAAPIGAKQSGTCLEENASVANSREGTRR